MVLKIIDVSSHQGNYNIGSYNEDGIIIKATQALSYINPNLDYVAKQAINKNKPWGIYHYAGGNDANAEANYFISIIQKYMNGNNQPLLILDWEKYQNSAYGNGKWAATFLNHLKNKLNIQGGIYGNSEDISQMPADVYNNAWLWFAGYPSSSDVGWNPIKFPYSIGKFKTLTGWQFSSNPIDKSLFYVTREQWNRLGNDVNHSGNNTNNISEDVEMVLLKVNDKKSKMNGSVWNFNGETMMRLDEITATHQASYLKSVDINQAQMSNYKDNGVKTIGAFTY